MLYFVLFRNLNAGQMVSMIKKACSKLLKVPPFFGLHYKVKCTGKIHFFELISYLLQYFLSAYPIISC